MGPVRQCLSGTRVTKVTMIDRWVKRVTSANMGTNVFDARKSVYKGDNSTLAVPITGSRGPLEFHAQKVDMTRAPLVAFALRRIRDLLA